MKNRRFLKIKNAPPIKKTISEYFPNTKMRGD